MQGPSDRVRAEVVVPCDELDPTLDFFVRQLGFRLDSIFPADRPVVAQLSGHGLRLRLEVGPGSPGGTLRLTCDGASGLARGELRSPGGMRIQVVDEAATAELPELTPSFVLTRGTEGPGWNLGRAGMRYRDLIPDRQGGAVIASHISIPVGGEVPDYVHFHRVQFQMIYCHRGWVRVVYEDQGPAFVMHAGDCVLQPPLIRHRVLECSDGLEVIELTTPARHATCADHAIELPTSVLDPERHFEGQRFLFARDDLAVWRSGDVPGFEVRDLETSAASGGLARVEVLRGEGPARPATRAHDADLVFLFVLAGEIDLWRRGAPPERLRTDDAVSLPRGLDFGLGQGSARTRVLTVALFPRRT